MAAVDDVEELGAAVSAGLLTRDEAVRQLVIRRAGGLTPTGAESVIDNWQTYRARFGDIRMAAEMGLASAAALRNQDDEAP